METRIMTQARIFILVLNTFGYAEEGRICAVSDNYDRLVGWYKDQFASEPYREDGYYKVFKKGSPIEYNNPCNNLEINCNAPYGFGIRDQWIDIRCIDNIKNDYLFI